MNSMRPIAISLVFAVSATFLSQAQEPEKKITITDVMKQAHKKPKELLKKVARGKATDAEKQQLLKLYKVLAKSPPPKGVKAAWEIKTKAMVAAADAAVKGKKDVDKLLLRAANCMACHRDHK